MTYIPDPIERAEMAAESAYYDMTSGMSPGMFRCECGYAGHFDTAIALDSSPWASPVCEMCRAAYCQSRGIDI